MNWSRTKLIFIVAFLILDLFLAFQLYEKYKNAGKIQSLPSEDTPEERLEASDITLTSELPDIKEDYYNKGNAASYQTENQEVLPEVKKKGKNAAGEDVQEFTTKESGFTLVSEFQQPPEVSDETNNDDYK